MKRSTLIGLVESASEAVALPDDLRGRLLAAVTDPARKTFAVGSYNRRDNDGTIVGCPMTAAGLMSSANDAWLDDRLAVIGAKISGIYSRSLGGKWVAAFDDRVHNLAACVVILRVED